MPPEDINVDGESLYDDVASMKITECPTTGCTPGFRQPVPARLRSKDQRKRQDEYTLMVFRLSTTGSWQDRWGDHLQSGDAANTRLIHSDNWRQIFDHSTTGCTRPSGFRRTARRLRCDEYANEEDTGRERGYKCSRGDDAAAAITRYNATALRNFTAPYYIIGAACVSGGMVGRDTTGKAPLLPADEHLGHRQCRLCIIRRLSVRRINRETFLLQRSSDELHFTITLWAQNGAE